MERRGLLAGHVPRSHSLEDVQPSSLEVLFSLHAKEAAAKPLPGSGQGHAPQAAEKLAALLSCHTRSAAEAEMSEYGPEPAILTPFLVLGSARDAKNPLLLRALNVTHVVNCAASQVAIGSGFYTGVDYKEIPAEDQCDYDVLQHLPEFAATVEDARRAGGCTFVHCRGSASRSSALCIAYLAIHTPLPLLASAWYCKRQYRPTCVNDGFQRQLLDLALRMRWPLGTEDLLNSDEPFFAAMRSLRIPPDFDPSLEPLAGGYRAAAALSWQSSSPGVRSSGEAKEIMNLEDMCASAKCFSLPLPQSWFADGPAEDPTEASPIFEVITPKLLDKQYSSLRQSSSDSASTCEGFSMQGTDSFDTISLSSEAGESKSTSRDLSFGDSGEYEVTSGSRDFSFGDFGEYAMATREVTFGNDCEHEFMRAPTLDEVAAKSRFECSRDDSAAAVAGGFLQRASKRFAALSSLETVPESHDSTPVFGMQRRQGPDLDVLFEACWTSTVIERSMSSDSELPLLGL